MKAKMKKQLQAYYAAQKAAHNLETFSTKEEDYNITVADFLVMYDDRDPDNIAIKALAIACGFDRDPVDAANGYLYFQIPNSKGKIEIHYKHTQEELDLSKPLMLLPNGKLIDGHHRLYQAFKKGIKTLPAHILMEEEVAICTNAQWYIA